MPLIVGGMGQRRWSWYEGSSVKIYGGRRAAQLVDFLAPSARMVVDGHDTVLAAHSPSATIERALAESTSRGRRPTVLASAECASWPKCYEDMYQRYAIGHDACVAGGLACFGNSGGYLASSGSTLQHMYERQIRLLNRWKTCSKGKPCSSYMGREVGRTERTADQSQLHFLYVNRSRHEPLPFELKLDSDSGVFLSLGECHGPNPFAVRGPMQACYAKRHPYPSPSRHLQFDASELSIRFQPPGRAVAHPLILHANGEGKERLKHATVLQLTNASSIQSPSKEMLAHPVLLLDERAAHTHAVLNGTGNAAKRIAGGGSQCRITTLGGLMRERGGVLPSTLL